MAELNAAEDVAPRPDDPEQGLDRRRFLQRVGVGTAVAWTVPQIVSQPAFAAGAAVPCLHPFVAVGGDGDGRTFTSDDFGATWPVATTPIANGEVHAVAY